MKKSVGETVGGGLDDVIGQAVGNYAGDAMANFLNNGKKAQLPPKPDFAALGTEIAIYIGDRVLGALLPNPLIPTKVATEFEKWYDSPAEGMNPDIKKNLTYEYNTDKKIIKLIEQNKVKGALSNAVKANKNILSQTKDFLISTAASVVGGLVKAGVSSLIRKGTNALLTNKFGNILMGNKGGQTEPITEYAIKYSSKNEYGKVARAESFKSIDEIGTLKAKALYMFGGDDVRIQLANNNLMKASFTNPQIGKLIGGLKYATPASVKTDKEILEEYNTIGTVGYTNTKDNLVGDTLFALRGMTSNADYLNLGAAIIYPGHSIKDIADDRTADEHDFVALKFYSTALDHTVQFRCTVSQLTETFSPSWEPNKFIGNPFNFYTYGGVERTLTFSFKIFSMNLVEHQNSWQRLEFLSSLTYPQQYLGDVGAVTPPLLKFTLGNMYQRKDAIIDSLTYTVDETIPWEIGMNTKATSTISPIIGGGGGHVWAYDANVSAQNWKLPMIVNVEITLKFVESRGTTSANLYAYA
jgi:hypothetical protein